MAKGKLRLGFVGTGQMGQCAHLKNYATLDGCEVAALAEMRANTGREVVDAEPRQGCGLAPTHGPALVRHLEQHPFARRHAVWGERPAASQPVAEDLDPLEDHKTQPTENSTL